MKRILTAIDFSEQSDRILAAAAEQARAFGARLWILHVTSDEVHAFLMESSLLAGYDPEWLSFPVDVEMARELSAEELKRERARLQEISAKLRKEGIDARALLLKGSDPADVIIEKTKELDVELAVLGSHGYGMFFKALVGSVSEAVLRKAPCNVLIVPIRNESAAEKEETK